MAWKILRGASVRSTERVMGVWAEAEAEAAVARSARGRRASFSEERIVRPVYLGRAMMEVYFFD